ncbi:MAG: UDP-3-O-(3-hydroxymyristoyl)glucosamine N-acyltransferase [Planctomycetes bacterium]|nr:UDP-3-O-(3-hydroxymyristoyl)glucosamine N-acyltransferase [Planctomycetota bacterium]
MTRTVAELAELVGGSVEGDGAVTIRGVGGLGTATGEQVSFVANPKYAPRAAETRAGALIVGPKFAATTTAALIRVGNPDAAFAQVATLFAPPPRTEPTGVHPSAVVGEGVRVGKDVSIGPQAVVERGAVIGDGTVLRACVYVGPGVQVGRQCLIYPHVTIREGTTLGDRVIIHAGTVVGADGFGYTVTGGRRVKIPQLGGVLIEDDAEIGANVTIDRARFDRTVIGRNVKIDNLVQIAHNVQIGENTVIVSLCAVAGSTTLGRNCVLGGQVAIDGHLTVGDNVMIAAKSGVTKDVPSNSVISGFPAQDHKHDLRMTAELRKLMGASKRLEDIEQRLSQLVGDRQGA